MKIHKMEISKRKNKFYNTERFGQPEIRVYHKKGWGEKMPRYLLITRRAEFHVLQYVGEW